MTEYSFLWTCLLLAHNSNMLKATSAAVCPLPKGSTRDTMKRLPLLGQVLGRLCWIPSVTADGECVLGTRRFIRLRLKTGDTYTLLKMCL